MSVSTQFAGNYVASMYGRVLEELTYSLNFTLRIVSELNEHGIWNTQNQTWSGVMGEIISGRADFAIADMSMTSFRVHYVDFTLPLIISRNSLYIKQPGICGVKWLGYFQVIWLINVKIMCLSLSRYCRFENNGRELPNRTSSIFCLISQYKQRLMLKIWNKWAVRNMEIKFPNDILFSIYEH